MKLLKTRKENCKFFWTRFTYMWKFFLSFQTNNILMRHLWTIPEFSGGKGNGRACTAWLASIEQQQRGEGVLLSSGLPQITAHRTLVTYKIHKQPWLNRRSPQLVLILGQPTPASAASSMERYAYFRYFKHFALGTFWRKPELIFSDTVEEPGYCCTVIQFFNFFSVPLSHQFKFYS